MFSKELLKIWYIRLKYSMLMLNLIPAYMGNGMHALSCPLLWYLIENKTLAWFCILFYGFIVFYMCEAPNDFVSDLCHPRSTFAIFRDCKSGTEHWRIEKSGTQSGVLVRVFLCYLLVFHCAFLLTVSFSFKISEDEFDFLRWKWVCKNLKLFCFVCVYVCVTAVIPAKQSGGLGSELCSLSNPWCLLP